MNEGGNEGEVNCDWMNWMSNEVQSRSRMERKRRLSGYQIDEATINARAGLSEGLNSI